MVISGICAGILVYKDRMATRKGIPQVLLTLLIVYVLFSIYTYPVTLAVVEIIQSYNTCYVAKFHLTKGLFESTSTIYNHI